MADLINIVPGRPPWQPGYDTELTDTFDFHDVPLTGIVAQHGIEYLFQCLIGEMEPLSYWLYTILLPGEAKDLRTEPSDPADWSRRLVGVAWDHPGVLAVASDALGVLSSVPIDRFDAEALKVAFDVLRESTLAGIEDIRRSVADSHLDLQLS